MLSFLVHGIKKTNYEFGKEKMFDIKQKGRPSNRDNSMIKLLNSHAIMASRISNTVFLPSDPDELCEEKQAGNNSDLINEEIVATIDELLDYKCAFKKPHKYFLVKCKFCTPRKSNYKYSYSRYTRMSIITYKNVSIHKYKYSYNCMYTQI